MDCFDHRRDSAGFAPQNYKVHYEDTDADIPPTLMVTNCEKIDKPVLDDFDRSQVWDCPNVDELLAEANTGCLLRMLSLWFSGQRTCRYACKVM